MIAVIKGAAVALLAAAAAALSIGEAPAESSAAAHPAQADVVRRFTAGNGPWINSAPLSPALLHGKVVLVNFWTYSCINSLRALPYTTDWAAKYRRAGLVVIGVHTPEFEFETQAGNVERAVRDLSVSYPVVMDSDYGIWHAFDNEYWPAFYLIDGKGILRYHYFGEGAYDKTEQIIRQLLRENGAAELTPSTPPVAGSGIVAAASNDEQSPETYIGYRRADQFASPERVAPDGARVYRLPARLSLNAWGLSGSWNIGAESAVLADAPGKIALRFHSRDLHFVLGPRSDGKPVRFKVTLDGAAPNDDHGTDLAPDGSGAVRAPRLYQLIRQKGRIGDRTFEIEFLDPGVHAYVFTFG